MNERAAALLFFLFFVAQTFPADAPLLWIAQPFIRLPACRAGSVHPERGSGQKNADTAPYVQTAAQILPVRTVPLLRTAPQALYPSANAPLSLSQ
jgi:hypothetical protein